MFKLSSLVSLLAIFFGIYLIKRISKIKRIYKKIPINIILGAFVLCISGTYMLFQSWRYDYIFETIYICSIFGSFICLTEMNSSYLEKRKTILSKIFEKIKYFKYFSILIAIFHFYGPQRWRVLEEYWRTTFWFELPIFLFLYLLSLSLLKIIIPYFANTSNADELQKYTHLKDQGIITQEEFQAKKKKLLDL